MGVAYRGPCAAGRVRLSGLRKLALQVTVGGALAGLVTAPAGAQWWQTLQPAHPAAAPPAGSRGENVSAGKPAAQLFASDCTGAGCHKGSQGLSKDRGQSSLASFLSEHYTTSRESAAALAAYLVGVRGGTARTDPKPPAKPAERRPPFGEPADIAKAQPERPAAKPPGDRQVTTATPAAAVPVPAPAPPALPPELPKPQWDIFD